MLKDPYLVLDKFRVPNSPKQITNFPLCCGIAITDDARACLFYTRVFFVLLTKKKQNMGYLLASQTKKETSEMR